MSTYEDDQPPTQEEVNFELHECARHGELDILKEMKESDDTNMLDFTVLDEHGNSVLHKAAANGHIEMLAYLKENGAKYNRNNSGKDPLTWAIINKQLDTVKWLIVQYADDIDVLFKPEFGLSPLSTAHDMAETDIIEALMTHPSVSALEDKNLEVDSDEDDEDEDDSDGEDGSTPASPIVDDGSSPIETNTPVTTTTIDETNNTAEINDDKQDSKPSTEQVEDATTITSTTPEDEKKE